jgi:hypothetical protein
MPIGVIEMITPTRLPLGLLPAPLPDSKTSPCAAVWAAADAAIVPAIRNAKKRIDNRESHSEILIGYPPVSLLNRESKSYYSPYRLQFYAENRFYQADIDSRNEAPPISRCLKTEGQRLKIRSIVIQAAF